MKNISLKLLVIISITIFSGCTSENTRKFITPNPSEILEGKGVFTFPNKFKISVENKEQEECAELFASLIENSKNYFSEINENDPNADIFLCTDKSILNEGYSLDISSNKIIIKSSSLSGFYYAFQTLRLLLSSGIEKVNSDVKDLSVPCSKIIDSPRFEYRGLMLDVARYFMPLSDVKQLIDCMSILKLNKLHIHFTDDTGWRLEIKKYPKLTEVGAWRVDRGNIPFYERRNQLEGEDATLGGFYTQEEIKEMVSYASERHVEIIPEIDVPAHSCAALASYPELSCPNVNKKITVLPGLGGRDTEIIYCAGNEKTFEFLFDVIDEVSALFPSKYIHMGGDEANKFYWRTCPLCRKRMADEGISEVEDLQGYFMNRINEHIRIKNKIMIGWDELTNSSVPEDAIVMGWQGFGNAALKAASEGHKFIMTPARLLYLIRYQGPQWFEPLTYFGNNLMKDIYFYEPVQNTWETNYSDLLLGVQASMWTEFCNSTDDVMYQVFPRLVALAEVAWCKKGFKNWDIFQQALDNYLAHLDSKGVIYARSMYNIQHKSVPSGNGIKLSLESERTDVDIRYTTDGTVPSSESNIYSDTLFFSSSTVLNAATFKNGTLIGKPLVLDLQFNKATGKYIKGHNKDESLLTNGVRGSLRQSDFEWCTWSHPVTTFVLDLQKQETINNITLSFLTNYGMGVHKPRSLKIEVSDDDKDYNIFDTRTFSDSEIFKEGNFIEDISFKPRNVKSRYVRFTFDAAGIIPDYHFMRPGQVSKFYIDEISIE